MKKKSAAIVNTDYMLSQEVVRQTDL